MIPAAAYYDDQAALLAPRYRDLTFAKVHAAFADYLPAAGGRVLDVGAGSGRDALALAKLGYHVVAVEPAPAMRAWAQARDLRAAVDWGDDHLPDLASVRSRGEVFDLILCSAVLMHVPGSALGQAFEAMAGSLAATGRLAITVRAAAASDPPGLFVSHSDDAIRDAASAAGLRCLAQGRDPDQMGRTDLSWSSFVFEHAAIPDICPNS